MDRELLIALHKWRAEFEEGDTFFEIKDVNPPKDGKHSIMIGVYPGMMVTSGYFDENRWIDDMNESLVKILKDAGYKITEPSIPDGGGYYNETITIMGSEKDDEAKKRR